MEAELVRLVAHPTDTHIAILRVPYHLNDLMGRYEPAMLAADLNGYLIPTAKLDSLYSFARFNSLYIVDERGKTAAQLERGKLCDICCKPRQVCQTAAGNVGSLHDHEFTSNAEADAKRTMPTPEEAQCHG